MRAPTVLSIKVYWFHRLPQFLIKIIFNRNYAFTGLQNSGASCFIVCIIDLVAALGVGVISLINKHVTACMVTGVLYCMASQYPMKMKTSLSLSLYHWHQIPVLTRFVIELLFVLCYSRFVHCFRTRNFPREASLRALLLPVSVPYTKVCLWHPNSHHFVGGACCVGGRHHLFSSQYSLVISDTCSQSHQSKNYDMIICSLFLFHVMYSILVIIFYMIMLLMQ